MNLVYLVMLKRRISLLPFLLVVASAYGQLSVPELPKVLQPSPNAASLGKYGDYPVGHYTGVTNVSIPLYTVQSGGITLPITLDYHLSGIRLKELAGWTGLGWTISAPGVINRQLKGRDDFSGSQLPLIWSLRE